MMLILKATSCYKSLVMIKSNVFPPHPVVLKRCWLIKKSVIMGRICLANNKSWKYLLNKLKHMQDFSDSDMHVEDVHESRFTVTHSRT